MTTFSELRATRKCFIGDYSGYSADEDNHWNGDELVVVSITGGISIQFEDEINRASIKGFLRRILGR